MGNAMNKKTYIQPTLESIPFCTKSALCDNIAVSGSDPELNGRVPRRRTSVF